MQQSPRQARLLVGQSSKRKLLVGGASVTALCLISVYLYYSRPSSDLSCQSLHAGSHLRFGLEEQNRLMEAIYQETQAGQNEQLAMLKPDDFSEGIAIMSQDGNDYKLKYIWDYWLPAYNCPLKEKIGIDPIVGDNGKWLCGVRTLLQRPGCIIYSFGSNGETTFEQDIIKKSRCEVHVFDPTLDEAVAAQVKAIKGVTFHPYGLGAVDGVIHLTDARSSMSRNLPSFEVKKLSTIMNELGHKWVDVLKIDIEGNEWPVLEGMIKDKAPFMFTQMQIEYHYYHQTNITVPKQMLSVLKGLTARDLRVFSVEPNYWWKNYAQEFLEFAYIQVSKEGNWVTGPEALSKKKLSKGVQSYIRRMFA